MDRGYVDFARLYSLHQAGAFFVTRAMSTMDVRHVYSATSDRTSGVICDQRVMLNGFYSARNYPEHLRRIRFRDPESGKTLVFLTNNTALPALRRLRPCTRAVGSSSCSSSGSSSTCASSIPWHQRGVKTQVWCAVATYVLIAIVVERAHRTRWPIDQAS